MLVLLLPLLVLRPDGLLRPQFGARLIPAAALVGLAVPAVAILGSAGPERQSVFAAFDLPVIYAQRIAGPALLGDSWFRQLWLAAGSPAAWVALALLAVPLAIRGTTELSSMTGALAGAGARYTFIPLLLAWVPLLLIADRRPGWARRLMLLLVLVVTLSDAWRVSLGCDRLQGPVRPNQSRSVPQ